MAILLPNYSSPEELNIVIEKVHPNHTEVYYLPTQDELNLANKGAETPDQNKTLMVRFNGQDGYIEISPIFTSPNNPDFLKPKYKQIEKIILELRFGDAPDTKEEVVGCLEQLPAGFIKDIQYGLGLPQDYRFIILAIEEQTKHKIIVINEKETNNADEDFFYLNQSDFNKMRRDCNRITDRSQKAARLTKTAIVYNHLAYLLGNEQKPLPTSKDQMMEMLQIKISNTDKQTSMNLVAEDKSAVKLANSQKLFKLKNNIELVTLERFIKLYQNLLSKKTQENTWQKLFNENPFILSLVFGYPAIKISGQASLGGKSLAGNGEKITDFLFKNDVTNNLAIIEIKKLSSSLLNKTPYRGGVFSASNELTGSVSQILDQCYQLQKNIATIKENSRNYEIESYAVHCILVIGTMPSNEDEKKSFEIYRHNSRNVQIITFDELLLKLRQLQDFLATNDGEESVNP